MSWSCDNTCHVITTSMARQIIAANSPSTLPFVEFTDLDGSPFYINVSDAPCLKIVIDLKDNGGLVLQKIGILLNNLTAVRNEIYESDALQRLRCFALCSSPFNVQLSSDVELIVCAGCDDNTCPRQMDHSVRYLMLIAFFLALLSLSYFMSMFCQFWCNRSRGCSVCASAGKLQQQVIVGAKSVSIPTALPPVIPDPERKNAGFVFDPSVLSTLSSDALLVLQSMFNTASDI